MKPLTLTLKNFGPYINETVDFTNFEESSLFLISGKTGAGKTTIFDGMSYALFGESSGKLRQGKELRSTFADPSEPTEVCLLFSHGEFLYEITRKPEQELFKKRGDGTRTQPAKISLIIKNPAGKELKEYTKRREVDSFIQELLHLDAEQFSQIVLLPQGEFRTFLIANSGEKEKVLRRLFGTQMYQALGEELKQQSKLKNKEIDQIRQKIEMKLEQIYWEQEPIEEPTEKQLQLLAEQQTRTEEKQVKLKIHIEHLKAQLKELEQKKAMVEEQQALSVQYTSLVAEQEGLLSRQDEIHAAKQKEQELLWVKTQEDILESIKAHEEELLEQKNRLRTTLLEKSTVDEQLKESQEQADQLAGRKDQMEEQHIQLTELTMKLPLYKEKEALEKEAEQDSLTVLAQKLKAEQKKMDDLLEEQNKLTNLLAELPQLEKQQLLLTQRQKDWQKIREEWQEFSLEQGRLSQSQKSLVTLKANLSEAKEKKNEVEKQRKSLQGVWAKMQISRLSLLLEEGEPCPVCGAVEHPKQLEHQAFSLEEIQGAEQQLNQVEQQLKAEEESVTGGIKDIEALESQINQLQELIKAKKIKILELIEASSPEQTVLDSEIDKEWIEEERRLLATVLFENEELLQELEDKKTGEAAVKQQIEQQEQLLLNLKTDYEEQRVKQQATQVKLETLMKQLDEHVTYSKALEQQQRLEEARACWLEEVEESNKRLLKLSEDKQTLTQNIQHLEQELHRSEQFLETSREKVARSLKENNISYKLEDIAHLLAELPELTALQTEIHTFEEQSREVSFKLEATKEKMSDAELPELSELEEQFDSEQQKISEQESLYYQENEKQAVNARISQEIQEAIRTADKKWEEVAALQQLADTINGDNLKKTSLERYVLQTYLRQVLKTANVRMASLTNSRYQFELNSEKNSYKNQTGLEINIYDDNAGASRSARTLSGGESFIAALALALSLAEVIQEQAGGVLIEALFIDEGFGSLDEEALEMAIEALETIENEGRMIGIISHVAELKSRISQQLQIKTNGAGQSSVSYQVM
ncbi:AAA family ATPase [uncultured Enterococcus sp.]|uniref:AAA family ATPase n=1 Tax=uncultured Enterococcus sp. TaxID=167972 RepID=UPI002AA743F5|nr:AAA family ATPase [uncultured Enterococcus sp.]